MCWSLLETNHRNSLVRKLIMNVANRFSWLTGKVDASNSGSGCVWPQNSSVARFEGRIVCGAAAMKKCELVCRDWTELTFV